MTNKDPFGGWQDAKVIERAEEKFKTKASKIDVQPVIAKQRRTE